MITMTVTLVDYPLVTPATETFTVIVENNLETVSTTIKVDLDCHATRVNQTTS